MKIILKIYFYIIFLNSIIFNASAASPSLNKEIRNFKNCLCNNRNKLEVRYLNDFFRIRGIPAKCCQSLAKTFFKNKEAQKINNIDKNNCRLNAFFIPNSVFDPHNHPLLFVSYIIQGGYTHTIFNIAPKNNLQNSQVLYTEHSKIYTKTDTIKKIGTVKLLPSYTESYKEGDFVLFNNTNTIHRIDILETDTLTINYLSTDGNKEIDVFVSHETPNRKVLSKSDTLKPVNKKIADRILNKCIEILRIKSITN